MTIASHLVVFFISWLLAFFTVLPWGVTGHNESGEEYPQGIDPGSPVKANMGRKMLITTGIAIILWAIFWVVMAFHLISIV